MEIWEIVDIGNIHFYSCSACGYVEETTKDRWLDDNEFEGCS